LTVDNSHIQTIYRIEELTMNVEAALTGEVDWTGEAVKTVEVVSSQKRRWQKTREKGKIAETAWSAEQPFRLFR
jgi:hypothetical protein